ncbi:MAG: hypothetical protein WD598_01775 [Acidimicrobiia bacterium]
MPTREAPTTDAPTNGEAQTAADGWRARLAGFDRRFPRGRIMLLLAGLVLVLNVTTVLRVDKVSRIDEQYWIDHLLHGADFSIDRGGVPILQETVREKCERGKEEEFLRPCKPGHLKPALYGYWHGVNITGAEPFYFFTTGPIARALRATPLDLPPNDSLVTWARLLGSAWALAGIYCLIRAGEILRVRRRMLVLASVFIVATPALLHANTIVTPDATALVAGGALLLAALSWERRGTPLWMLALVTLVVSAFNEKNGIGVLLVLGYFALRALAGHLGIADDDDDPRPWQDYVKTAGVLVVALFLANKGWDHLYAFIGDGLFTPPPLADISGNPIAASYGNRDIGLWHLFGPTTVFMMFPPFQDVAPPIERTHPLYLVLAKTAEFVAIGAMFAVALRDKLSTKLSVLGFATLGTLLASPTLTVIRNQLEGGTYDQPVWRFGLSALPALAIVLACAPRSRFAVRGMTVLVALLYVSAIYVVFHSPLPA